VIGSFICYPVTSSGKEPESLGGGARSGSPQTITAVNELPEEESQPDSSFAPILEQENTDETPKTVAEGQSSNLPTDAVLEQEITDETSSLHADAILQQESGAEDKERDLFTNLRSDPPDDTVEKEPGLESQPKKTPQPKRRQYSTLPGILTWLAMAGLCYLMPNIDSAHEPNPPRLATRADVNNLIKALPGGVPAYFCERQKGNVGLAKCKQLSPYKANQLGIITPSAENEWHETLDVKEKTGGKLNDNPQYSSKWYRFVDPSKYDLIRYPEIEYILLPNFKDGKPLYTKCMLPKKPAKLVN
jgi:hypothetical protein